MNLIWLPKSRFLSVDLAAPVGRLVGKFAYGHALKTVKMHIGL